MMVLKIDYINWNLILNSQILSQNLPHCLTTSRLPIDGPLNTTAIEPNLI